MTTFDDFWQLYPTKVGKFPCRQKWAVLMKQGVNPEAIMAGLRAYLRGKDDWKRWCNPLTFLNQRRWEDFEFGPGNSLPKPQSGPPIVNGCERPSDIPEGSTPVLATLDTVIWRLPNGERVTRPRFMRSAA